MDLYSRNISPFSARARISIMAKGLSVRVIDSPDVRSPDFTALNPLQRVPVLVLDDGTVLAESDTIVEYLEDAYPEIPLRPAAAADRARVRLIARVAELYVFPAVVPIFVARATGDAAQVSGLFDALELQLRHLERALDASASTTWHAFGNTLTTADGALAPFLFYVDLLGKTCARTPLAGCPRLQRFWDGAQSQPVLAAVIGQIAQAMAAARQRAT